MRSGLVFLLLAVAALAQAPDLAGKVRRVDRDAARRLFSLAQRADADGQRAVAVGILARVLELDADHVAARAKLGYKDTRQGWHRGPEAEAELLARADADPVRAEEFRREAARLAEERIRELIRTCARHEDVAERQAYLLPLLEKMPRRADLHEALGHEKIGDNWVRPELAAAVRLLPLRLQAWKNHARDPVAVEPSSLALAIPGVEGPLVFRRADGCEVASAPDLGSAPAEAVARTRGFLRFVLGDDAALWTPPPLVFLGAAPYDAMVRALHPDEAGFELYRKFENYEHRDFYAIRVYGEPDAAERYAHGAGYLTMYGLAAGGDERAHAWLLEGFGYVVSLELFDRGYVSYSSIEESKAKTTGTRPPPPQRTRDACHAWIREEMREHRDYPLAAVCAKSINDLDFCASLEAWSFVRFLFLLDPEGARKLPAALREQPAAPQAQQVDRALAEAFGKDLAELERLWRAFVLEID